MKTLRFKVFGFAAMALLLAATVVSCSKDDDKKDPEDPNASLYGTYTGGEYASFYGQKRFPQTDAKAEIILEENKTITLIYTSPLWSTFTFNNINVNNENNKYIISGEGTMQMAGMPNMPGVPSNPAHGSGELKTYSATISAEVQNDKMVATITAAIGAMGDVEILFNPADFDEILNAPSSK